jgi:hypothetical protein
MALYEGILENKLLKKQSIKAKTALKFGSEAWVLKKRDEQRLEAARMKILRHLLGITKTGEKSIREGATWSAEHCSGNKTLPTRVAATRRENGHRQDTPTGTEI